MPPALTPPHTASGRPRRHTLAAGTLVFLLAASAPAAAAPDALEDAPGADPTVLDHGVVGLPALGLDDAGDLVAGVVAGEPLAEVADPIIHVGQHLARDGDEGTTWVVDGESLLVGVDARPIPTGTFVDDELSWELSTFDGPGHLAIDAVGEPEGSTGAAANERLLDSRWLEPAPENDPRAAAPSIGDDPTDADDLTPADEAGAVAPATIEAGTAAPNVWTFSDAGVYDLVFTLGAVRVDGERTLAEVEATIVVEDLTTTDGSEPGDTADGADASDPTEPAHGGADPSTPELTPRGQTEGTPPVEPRAAAPHEPAHEEPEAADDRREAPELGSTSAQRSPDPSAGGGTPTSSAETTRPSPEEPTSLATTAGTGRSHDGRLVLDVGHVDAFEVTVDGDSLTMSVKDDTFLHDDQIVYRDPDDVLLQALPGSAIEVPASAELDFLGEPGDTVHLLPQTQDPDLLWPGWSTERMSSSAVDGPVRLSITDVAGPGDLKLFLSSTFGGSDVLADSSAGLPATWNVNVPAHVHGNWAFTETGPYTLTVRADATLSDGSEVSTGDVDYRFHVGDLTDGGPGGGGDGGDGGDGNDGGDHGGTNGDGVDDPTDDPGASNDDDPSDPSDPDAKTAGGTGLGGGDPFGANGSGTGSGDSGGSTTAGDDTLASTGASTTMLIVLGLVLVTVGLAAIRAGRIHRRRPASSSA